MDVDDECDMEKEKLLLFDNLRALLKQEMSGNYKCKDYLSSANSLQAPRYQLPKKKAKLDSLHANARIDEYCREQIVEWSFRVVDYFRIDREVVALSLSFLDRFLASCRCDRTSFKLAATTTLHLAVKLLYPCKLADLGILSDLSRGEFDMRDVTRMEAHILQALKWNLHPPTAAAFSTLFLDYFFSASQNVALRLSKTDLDDIYDVTSFFCELAICDYFFVPMRDSAIMMSAILNALEGMFGPDNRLGPVMMQAAQNELRFGNHLQDLTAARNRLWELYERSEECALHNDKSSRGEHDSIWHGGSSSNSIFVKKNSNGGMAITTTTSSPVSVSKPCHPASAATTSDDCFGLPLTSSGTSPAIVRSNESW